MYKKYPDVIKRKRIAKVNPMDIEELLMITAEDPELVAEGMERDKLEIFLSHVGDLRRYYQERKAYNIYNYLNTEVQANKRDYEEMWFKARQEKNFESFIETVKQRMARGAENTQAGDMK